MRKITIVIIMGIFSIFCSLFGCTPAENFKSVEVDEFAQVISDTTVVRLDVRTASEYEDGHIAGAVNIDVLKGSFEEKAQSTLPKDKTIALYCRSGNRSKKAARKLTELGYNVVELDSGFKGWTKAGKDIVK